MIIVHFSVDWWRSLHQTATITRLDPTIEGTMLFTLMLGIVVFGLLFTWLLIHRFRVGWLEERIGTVGLDQAIVERRAEAGMVTPVIAMTHAYHVALGWGIALTVLGRLRPPHGAPRPLAGRAGAAGAAPVELSPADGARPVRPPDRAAPAQPLGLRHPRRGARRRRRGRVPGAHLGVAVLLQRRRGRRAARRLGDKRIRVQGTVQDDVDTDRRRRDLHDRVQRRRGAGGPRRRPAGALRARHPGGARGPLGRRRSTPSSSDEILVKHDEQYEADNGDRIADAEDGQSGDDLGPVNATLGTAGIVLGVAASALGIVTVAWGLRKRRPALLETGWSYSLLVLLGAVVAVIAMQRALDHPRLLA